MEKNETEVQKENEKVKKRKGKFYPYLIMGAVAAIYFVALQTEVVYAAPTIWQKAETIMKDVYGKIVGISTVAAIVTSSVALLMMNFSTSGKIVEEARAWLKRIVICWIILNSLGFIMAYITPLFSGGKWTG